MKKTHDEYIVDVMDVNPNIDVLGKYINMSTPILHKCKIDGFEWMARPGNILSLKGCPKCANRNNSKKCAKTHEKFVEEMRDKHPDIDVVGHYVNWCTKIEFRCKVDGNTWMATPNNVLCGTGCPVCGMQKTIDATRKTHDQFVYEMSIAKPNIEVLGEYKNSKQKILCRCKIDGYEWYVKPYSILSQSGCPKCRSSHGETFVAKYLDEHNIAFVTQYMFNDCVHIRPLKFDFYIPDYNICIEYDGRQHYTPVEYFGGETELFKTQKLDNIKNEYCLKNKIHMLRIKFDQDPQKLLDEFFEQYNT